MNYEQTYKGDMISAYDHSVNFSIFELTFSAFDIIEKPSKYRSPDITSTFILSPYWSFH